VILQRIPNICVVQRRKLLSIHILIMFFIGIVVVGCFICIHTENSYHICITYYVCTLYATIARTADDTSRYFYCPFVLIPIQTHCYDAVSAYVVIQLLANEFL